VDEARLRAIAQDGTHTTDILVTLPTDKDPVWSARLYDNYDYNDIWTSEAGTGATMAEALAGLVALREKEEG